MSRRRVWLCSVVLVSACGAQKPRPEQAAEEQAAREAKAAALAALFERENAALPTQPVASSDGAVQAELETSGAPTIALRDDVYEIAAPFVADQALHCVVTKEARDTGDVIRVLSAATLSKAAPQHEWVDVHADHVDGWGYVIGRAKYVVEGKGGKLMGDYKVAASTRGDTTALCLLDVPGYYQSFERAARSFFGSLQTAANRAQALASEESITRAQVAGKLASITREAHYKKGKTVEHSSFTTELMIGPDGRLQTSDDGNHVTYQRGRLEKGKYASNVAGELEHSLELSAKGKSYQVSGTVQDAPVQAEFVVKEGLPDRARVLSAFCSVRKGKKRRVELSEFEPSLSPVAATPYVLEKASAAPAEVVATLGAQGGVKMALELDEECDVLRGTVELGGTTLSLERLFQVKRKR